MENNIIAVAKDFLILFVYPIIIFMGKKVMARFNKIEKAQNQHSTRIAVTESQVKTINDDIHDIKNSIDRLPERIKNDIKDILDYDRK